MVRRRGRILATPGQISRPLEERCTRTVDAGQSAERIRRRICANGGANTQITGQVLFADGGFEWRMRGGLPHRSPAHTLRVHGGIA